MFDLRKGCGATVGRIDCWQALSGRSEDEQGVDFRNISSEKFIDTMRSVEAAGRVFPYGGSQRLAEKFLHKADRKKIGGTLFLWNIGESMFHA